MQVQPVVVLREASPAGKVPAMPGAPTAYQYRKVLNRQNADSLKIVYDIPNSEFKPGCCHKMIRCCTCQGCFGDCCKCGCMDHVAMAAKESRYTWVMENRVEFNRPHIMYQNKPCAPCLCKYRVVDVIDTVHFDDDMYDYIGTVNRPCLAEFCCGTFGDMIEFRRPVLGCPSAKLCGRTVATLHVSKGDGEKTVDVIKSARDSARARMTA